MNKTNPHLPPHCPLPRSTQLPIPVLLGRLSDRDLLDGWRRDASRAAFDELVRRYRVLVLSVCRRHCCQDQDADDAFQMTWVCLAQTAWQIRHPDRLAGWLHRVATRASQTTLKQRRRTDTSSGSRASTEQIEMNEIAGDDEEAFVVLSRRHEAIVLDEELAKLPDQYRTAIVMHLLEGDSYQNIAERLESTVGAIRGHVQRGKQVLAARLRHRGIVPVLAYAAVQMLQVGDSVAADIASQTIPAGMDLSTAQPSSLPEPTGPPVNLSSLSKSGSTMFRVSSWVAGACLATAAVAGLCLSQVPALGEHGARPLTVQMSDGRRGGDGPQVVVGQFGAALSPNQPAAPAPPPFANPFPAAPPKPPEKPQPNEPDYRTQVARRVAEKMDSEVSIDLTATLDALADKLSEQLGVPVLVDAGAVEQAGLKPSQTSVTMKSDHQPLRSSLRKFLQPLGLRAEVQDEGLAITVDYSVLAKRGMMTDKWVGMSDEFIAKVDEALATEVALPQDDTELELVIAEFSRLVDFPMTVNRTALEGVGLTADTPVRGYMRGTTSEQANVRKRRIRADVFARLDDKNETSDEDPLAENEATGKKTDSAERDSLVQKLPLGKALDFILQDLELTHTIRSGMIQVTTMDDENTRLLPRLYFLEGTGLPRGDLGSATTMIQYIDPDAWEVLGGESTIIPVGNGEYARPTLLVSTTRGIHQKISELMESLRESHVGPDPVWSGRPPAPGQQAGGVPGGMF